MKWEAKRGKDHRQEKYKECLECDGQGEWEYTRPGTIWGMFGNPEPDIRLVRCPECAGEGEIVDDDEDDCDG